MSRTRFTLPEAHVVVSSEGFFDVYPSADRSDGDRPAYRGRLAELGASVRGLDDRLGVRPDSPLLAQAVRTWSTASGAAAVRGDLGRGRDGNEAVA